jgi:hypothetical protein
MGDKRQIPNRMDAWVPLHRCTHETGLCLSFTSKEKRREEKRRGEILMIVLQHNKKLLWIILAPHPSPPPMQITHQNGVKSPGLTFGIVRVGRLQFNV